MYEQKKESPLEAFERVASMSSNYNDSHAKNTNRRKELKWKPSFIDFLKLNVDGVVFFFFNLQKAGIGCIVRDHSSKVIIEVNVAK